MTRMHDETQRRPTKRDRRRKRLRHAVHVAVRLPRRIVYQGWLAELAARYNRGWHRSEVDRLWASDTPPEWFDQRSNLARFTDTRDPLWAERGVYSRELVRPGDVVLDLCTGGGFYPYHFFTDRSAAIDAVDWGESAIASAKRWHSHDKIRFSQADIIHAPFPRDRYDVVIWDAAIEHFAIADARLVLTKIAAAIAPDGALGGYTLIPVMDDKSHPMHEHEYETADELVAVLHEFFPVVITYENTTDNRHNIYFRAGFGEDRLAPWRAS